MYRMDLPKHIVVFFTMASWWNLVLGQVDLAKDWNSDKFKEEAAQTFNLVFHKYNPRVRPPEFHIEVLVNIRLRHVRHLDLHKQELQTVLDVEMNWIDSRLRWYPDKVKQLSVNTSTAWTPDIVYTNSVSETRVLYPNNLIITDTGSVTWIKKEVVTTLCKTDPTSRSQNCSVSLGFMSNNRNARKDRFFSSLSNFSVPADFQNHEWQLEHSELILEDVDNLTSLASSIQLHLELTARDKTTSDDPTPYEEDTPEGDLEVSSQEREKTEPQSRPRETNTASRIILCAPCCGQSCLLGIFSCLLSVLLFGLSR